MARTPVCGRRLVAGRTLSGAWRWIAARAVWLDADDADLPDRPQPVGLGVGRSLDEAVGSGLLDRLDLEAGCVDDRTRRRIERVGRPRGGRELAVGRLERRLLAASLDVVVVDLGAPGLAGRGIRRVSVQLNDERDVVGRRWDAAVRE